MLNKLPLLYAAGLLAWYVQHLIVPNVFFPLALLNGLALYLFLPLPVLVAVSVWQRRWPAVGLLALGCALAVFYWGALFWPNDTKPTGAPTLTVATYNVLGSNMDSDSIIASIEAMDADFVALEELNPRNAAQIATRLRAKYPYQLLRPLHGTVGMGVISKLPFTESETALFDDAWEGPPIIVSLDFQGTDVTVVALHATTPFRPTKRDNQLERVAAFARAQPGPAIVTGDFNTTSTERPYAQMRHVLRDAWHDAGTGFGHTFPGASQNTTPGSSRYGIGLLELPQRLIRIDYVFYSGAHWRAIDAKVGDHGGSDHHPLKAVLEMKR